MTNEDKCSCGKDLETEMEKYSKECNDCNFKNLVGKGWDEYSVEYDKECSLISNENERKNENRRISTF